MKTIKKIFALTVIVALLVINVYVVFSTDSKNVLDLNNIEAVANNESTDPIWGYTMEYDRYEKCYYCDLDQNCPTCICRVSDQCCEIWGNCP